jgi:hypothetical protein
MAKAIDLTGNKYGKLLVLERAEDYVSFEGNRYTQWLCRCDCGNECVVRSSSLISNATNSCGCGKRGKKRGRKAMSEVRRNQANICIDCKKACGGCSWSAADPVTGKLLFQPVPGWTAEEVTLSLGTYGNGIKRVEKTYRITACPLFEGEEYKIKQDYNQLTPEQSEWFLNNVNRLLREWADG